MKPMWLLGLVLAMPAAGWAEVKPPPGKADPHVRTVPFAPQNVVRLTTFYGVATHVEFGSGEMIVDYVSGDDGAWTIKSHANHLYLKPKGDHADTNLTVITSSHTYHFALVVAPRHLSDARAWTDPEVVYSLQFTYPDLRQTVAPVAVASSPARLNTNYWVAGARELWPQRAYDDGRLVHLRFGAQQSIPAVFEVADGMSEIQIPWHIEGTEVVVHRLAAHLVLRLGSARACIVNRGAPEQGSARGAPR